VQFLFGTSHNPFLIQPIAALTIFLVVMTNFILLIGAGLFTKAVNSYQEHACVSFPCPTLTPFAQALFSRFAVLLGADADDSGGTGPGSYDVRGNVWHLDCCSPESTFDGQGWTIFNALFGWTNNATGTHRRLSFICRNAHKFSIFFKNK